MFNGKVKNVPSFHTAWQGVLSASFWRKLSAPLMIDPPFVTDDKPKEHLRRSLPKAAEADCNDECSHQPEAEETRSSTPEMPAVSAFFSLAALAEVAAMENVHRLELG